MNSVPSTSGPPKPISGPLPILESSEGDIFITGYPKSGNTWCQSLAAAILHNLDLENVPDSLVQTLVPDVHYRQMYERFSEPMAFKTHDLPSPRHRRAVFLIRDGRDVMVSQLHHCAAVQKLRLDQINYAAHVRLYAPAWRDHVEAWLRNPHQADMITIRYENLVSDCARELGRLSEFIGIMRSPGELASIARKGSFEAMRNREKRFGWDNPSWPREHFFIRRGKIGSYQDEMPAEILRIFLDIAGDTLSKCGYPIAA